MKNLAEAKPWLTLWEAINIVGSDALPAVSALRRLPSEFLEYLLITEGTPGWWGDQPLPERVRAGRRRREEVRGLLLESAERWRNADREWHQAYEPKVWTRALERLGNAVEAGRVKVTGLRDVGGDRCQIPAEQWCDLTIVVLDQVARRRGGGARSPLENLAKLGRRKPLMGCWTDLRFWTADVLALRSEESRGRKRVVKSSWAATAAAELLKGGEFKPGHGLTAELIRRLKNRKDFPGGEDSMLRKAITPTVEDWEMRQPHDQGSSK